MVARRRLMHNGYLSVTVVVGRNGQLATDPRVQVQGVPVEEDLDDFREECVEAAAKVAPSKDEAKYGEALRIAVRRVARDWTGKKPVTDVQVVRL